MPFLEIKNIKKHFQKKKGGLFSNSFDTVKAVDGVSIQIESFWAAHRPNEVQIEIFGTEAGAKTNPLTIYRNSGGQPEDLTPEVEKQTLSFERVAEHFISCILDGKTCQAPLQQGLEVQRMMEAILNSAETRQPIDLSNQDV